MLSKMMIKTGKTLSSLKEDYLELAIDYKVPILFADVCKSDDSLDGRLQKINQIRLSKEIH